ncbi:MAG TPA: hypothetical protein VEX18_11365 [Polyangiaceae bacterium]|nr:hypothetical protein [Polyangiaceae bacterium]
MSRSDVPAASEEPQPANESDPAVEALRVDLIAYLARRFDVPHEAVLARLGDWLLDPNSEEGRKQYARANYLRAKS